MKPSVAIKFQGGPADRQLAVWPGEDPPEFIDYFPAEGGEVQYRHYARPSGKSPYHVYLAIEAREHGKDS